MKELLFTPFKSYNNWFLSWILYFGCSVHQNSWIPVGFPAIIWEGWMVLVTSALGWRLRILNSKVYLLSFPFLSSSMSSFKFISIFSWKWEKFWVILVEIGAPTGTLNLLSTIDNSGGPTQLVSALPQYIGGYGSTFSTEKAQNGTVNRFVPSFWLF